MLRNTDILNSVNKFTKQYKIRYPQSNLDKIDKIEK
jgi:hypothetical protein